MLAQVLFHQGFRYRIDPKNPEQVFKHILSNGGCVRKVHNLYVDYLYNELESMGYQGGPVPKIRYPELTVFKKQFPFLKEADSLGLCNAKIDFENSVKKFNEAPSREYTKRSRRREKSGGTAPTFRDIKGIPKFHCKKDNCYSYTTNSQDTKNGSCTVRLSGEMLHVPKLKTDIKLILHRPLPEGATIKNVTLSMEPDGAFYASICVEYAREVDMTVRQYGLDHDMEAISRLKGIGLDYSQGHFYADSEGRTANCPHAYLKALDKLARLQRDLSRMEKGSKNYEKQLGRIRKLHMKVKNQRKDFCHTESTRLAREYDFVAVEDIDLRAMSQGLHLGKKLMDNGFGMFREYLAYKLERKGSILVKVDRIFASSQTCSRCGYKNPEVKDLKVREWVCPCCGARLDRDNNAADNVLAEAYRIFAEYCTVWQKEKDEAAKTAAKLKAGRKKPKNTKKEAAA